MRWIQHKRMESMHNSIDIEEEVMEALKLIKENREIFSDRVEDIL